MHAIIETGGKQYKVAAGDTIFVEKLNAEVGTSHTFDRVLSLIDGDATVFGKPLVAGASVSATIAGVGKAKKVIVYKYKAKKGFHKKKGHRQPFTRVKIEAINKK
ncbi:MAG: 50S ribosomal protein L21 [Defluviitaleaceae bacterium]|nr:50S ribosomal protein L21 [Defluviitaleaceae bacterium]MCL2276067.1 50S ribosomal protein L21 [Defluviitaleaceae bacterium]